MSKNSIFCGATDMKSMLFFEVSIGIIANTALLSFHALTFLLGHRPRPIDLTIGHLALIHIVMLLSESVLVTDNFVYQILGFDTTCASVIYLNRLMTDLSIATTCLLSILQAITVSPRGSCLAKFKQKSLHQNLCCFLFLWVFNMLINGRFLISAVATSNVTSLSVMFLTKSCSLLPVSPFLKYLFLSLMIFKYLACITLMALSSVYMVILLCRHKRQSKHLHRNRVSSKPSPEQRATWTILLLMSFFIVMYCLDCVFHSTSSVLWSHFAINNGIQMLVGSCYATMSPFVLIICERQVTKCIRFME
ncbi:vomeronasal type-1 receptor 90-like [Octodon degus]|uniref:Vomeronasal type-1 receptor n=1 Tax=Octodon degus TaxID=10160 RepID=A0A6P3FJH8_OCTDE|nr:vomeronasal type-1 receptor 90-like [Octodon degus]